PIVSASPTPAASASPPSLAPVPAAYSVDVTRLLTASSFAAVIDARARLATDELAALEERHAALEADRDRATVEVNSYIALLDHRGATRDRLRREALRVVGGGGDAPADLSALE